MSKLGAIFVSLSLMLGSLSAQAKEVELDCYTLKGYPGSSSYIIDTTNRKVSDKQISGADYPPREYQILSWSPNKIIFSTPPSPSRNIRGHTSYTINRVNLDYYVFYLDKNELLEQQLFGKCEIDRTQPQF
jgi:hypothetical protein